MPPSAQVSQPLRLPSVSERSVRPPWKQVPASALEAGARQPEKADHYRLTAIIVGALVEGACLFAILVCLIGK